MFLLVLGRLAVHFSTYRTCTSFSETLRFDGCCCIQSTLFLALRSSELMISKNAADPTLLNNAFFIT
jgi:hypothetical protein